MTQTKAQAIIFADVGDRTAALVLDIVVLGVVASLAASAGLAGPYLMPLLFFLYFAGMPLSPLQGTPGKRICRIKLCDRFGRRLSLRASAVRAAATMGWFAPPLLSDEIAAFGGLDSASLSSAWWLLFALPWAPAGFLPRRESLFDLLAGSLVARYGADAESVAHAEPARKPGVLNVAGAVFVCLGTGAALSIMIGAQHDMNRRARVAYAVQQTEPLRQKIADFHEREQRWPTAGELGISNWTPYRDGGGYRLQADGSIVITFTVLQELKGHSISFRPQRSADEKKIHWLCSADAGFKPGYLPASCR